MVGFLEFPNFEKKKSKKCLKMPDFYTWFKGNKNIIYKDV